MTEAEFKQAVYDYFQIQLTDQQLTQFAKYYELLVEWNQKINLTAITAKEDVYLKHFFDSLTLLEFKEWQNVETIADIGAGAGFPSLPLKIIYPHLKVTIIDSLNKRIKFLDTLTTTLELDDVTLCHARAEVIGQSEQRASFDVVTARAVARLNILSELCVPLVKKDGYFIALKGNQGELELTEAKHALQVLCMGKMENHQMKLPNGDERDILIGKKTKDTPKKYPRKEGVPNRKPL